jgi:polyribonucleotide nucleotidyltransferase
MKEAVTVAWGGRALTLETGHLAKQASGAIVARYGETVVLVTAVAAKKPREGIDFFPLSCDYQEMTYAAGKIPGGFFKREGRPSEREVLTSRLIDRPLRPLFPDGFRNDVQIIATVLSADGENDSDVVAITAASAALTISDIPFEGPIAGVRVGRINGEFVINPLISTMAESDLELVMAASRDAVVMVEGGADCVSEDVLLDAIMFGHTHIQELLDAQLELRSRVGREKTTVIAPVIDADIEQAVRQQAEQQLRVAFAREGKHNRNNAASAVRSAVKEALAPQFEGREAQIGEVLHTIESEIIRSSIITERKRLDGRGPEDIRQIDCEVAVLPRTHGSALFTRGETQALVSTTLGTSEDEQRVDSLLGESKKQFMLHYNFPPFCVGEARPLRGTSRRETGHGALAGRAIQRVLPAYDDFPYTIRIVSEILESNGSSSMASVCGSTLSLMDAGVPIKAPVAGIAMGLIQDRDTFVVLSDILGDEDHVGDMDFKVAGTRDGVTAIQMDIKISGLSREILSSALEQARRGRLHILDNMQQTLAEPRTQISERAPRIETIQINPEKISAIIGPGGKNIKNIVATSGAKVDVDDTGKVKVASPDKVSIDKAIAMIKALVEEAEIGKVYVGTVRRITDFGAFVEILPGMDGLVHISQLANERVASVRDVLSEGQEVLVKVLEIDSSGKIRLSRKAVLDEDIEKYRK